MMSARGPLGGLDGDDARGAAASHDVPVQRVELLLMRAGCRQWPRSRPPHPSHQVDRANPMSGVIFRFW